MRIAAVLNLSAGSLLGVPKDDAIAIVDAALRTGGADVTVAAVERRAIRTALTEAIQSDADVIVAAGGDGTVAAAANLIRPTGKVLGILPAGTMNLLGRDLGVPLGLAEGAHALAHGTIRRIDVAEVNGEIFLNNSVLGLYPAAVRERERQRGTNRLRKWPAMVVGVAKALQRFPVLDVAVDTGTGPRHLKTPFLAVSVGPYDAGYGPVLRRSQLDTGAFGIYVAHHRSVWSMLRLILRMGLGTWADDEELDCMKAPRLMVHSRRQHLHLANDGEIRRLNTPLDYRIHPCGLRVLAP